jgi:hypothetical protein
LKTYQPTHGEVTLWNSSHLSRISIEIWSNWGRKSPLICPDRGSTGSWYIFFYGSQDLCQPTTTWKHTSVKYTPMITLVRIIVWKRVSLTCSVSLFGQWYVLPISVGGLDIVVPVPLVPALSPPSQSCSTSHAEGGRMTQQKEDVEVINSVDSEYKLARRFTNKHTLSPNFRGCIVWNTWTEEGSQCRIREIITSSNEFEGWVIHEFYSDYEDQPCQRRSLRYEWGVFWSEYMQCEWFD